MLFNSEVWTDIVLPLILESKAGVSGRFTNGRFYKGDLTRTNANRDELAGYQRALEELVNNLDDFRLAKINLQKKKVSEENEKNAPLYNPFMEPLDNE